MISSIPCTKVRRPLSVCFIGHQGCGKTSIIRSFGTNTAPRPTSKYGVNFDSQSVVLENGMNVQFQVYEIAGQDCFDAAALSIITQRSVDACVIMFDMTNKESFITARKWTEKLKGLNLPSVQLLLVANKKDLVRSRTVSCEEAYTFAESQDISYAETSSKRSKSGKKLFADIACKCYQHR